MVISLERGADLHTARLMPLPLTVSCSGKIQICFYRAMLCIRGTSHGPVSVRLSVCPSQVGVLLKRLSVGSHKQHCTTAQDSSFRMPKISAKFHRDHPLRGRQIQVGWVKIGDFRQITSYISKTVKDRHIVSIIIE